jgi:hypothetical protein
MKQVVNRVAAILALFLLVSFASSAKPKKEYFEIRVYHFATSEQENIIDSYLKQALLPALHKKNITRIGVFKPIFNDTAVDKKIVLLIPYKSMEQFIKTSAALQSDQDLQQAGSAYINATYDKPPYTRFETILVTAFDDMTYLEAPKLTAPKSERIYELRSYEGHTEKIYKNKVEMFNKGGEVKLFKRLGFNAVFYGEVIAGSRMPNLMYMTSFESRAEREAHWKTFVADPEWKVLSSKPEYQKNVSKNDTWLMKATEYSDL